MKQRGRLSWAASSISVSAVPTFGRIGRRSKIEPRPLPWPVLYVQVSLLNAPLYPPQNFRWKFTEHLPEVVCEMTEVSETAFESNL